jgi:hypothetical protein
MELLICNSHLSKYNNPARNYFFFAFSPSLFLLQFFLAAVFLTALFSAQLSSSDINIIHPILPLLSIA